MICPVSVLGWRHDLYPAFLSLVEDPGVFAGVGEDKGEEEEWTAFLPAESLNDK